jgi:hypothetical protein
MGGRQGEGDQASWVGRTRSVLEGLSFTVGLFVPAHKLLLDSKSETSRDLS